MNSIYWLIGLTIYVLSGSGLGALFASLDGWLTKSQMLARKIARGLPWWEHGGMKGDIFIMNPLAICLTWRHREAWDAKLFTALTLGCFAICNFADAGMTKGGMPQSHFHDERRTATGWVHIFYAAPVFTVTLMAFFFTPGIEARELFIASALITIHICWGMQFDLKIKKPFWYPYRITASDLKILAGVVLASFGTATFKALV